MPLLVTDTDAATTADYLRLLGILLIFVGGIFTMGITTFGRPNRGSSPREIRKYRVMTSAFPAVSLTGVGLLWWVAIASGHSPLAQCAPECSKVWLLGIVFPVLGCLVLPLWFNLILPLWRNRNR
jgi:hypothetical protein